LSGIRILMPILPPQGRTERANLILRHDIARSA